VTFLESYRRARDEKDSILCVGLDPAVPGSRPSNTIAESYLEDRTTGEALLNFCVDIIDATSDYACAFKPNSQYVLFQLSFDQLTALADAIRGAGAVSILDHKLADIGSTNASAIHWISEAGFDAFTFSPYAGNIREVTEAAHEKNLGVFPMGLMSNSNS